MQTWNITSKEFCLLQRFISLWRLQKSVSTVNHFHHTFSHHSHSQILCVQKSMKHNLLNSQSWLYNSEWIKLNSHFLWSGTVKWLYKNLLLYFVCLQSTQNQQLIKRLYYRVILAYSCAFQTPLNEIYYVTCNHIRHSTKRKEYLNTRFTASHTLLLSLNGNHKL